jgi:hypothetical protein
MDKGWIIRKDTYITKKDAGFYQSIALQEHKRTYTLDTLERNAV